MNEINIKEKLKLDICKVDTFFSLPYESQLKKYFLNDYLHNYGKELVRYQNLDRYASLEHIDYKLKFSGKAFFLKQNNTAKFLYDKEKKKIIYNNYNRDMLLDDLCRLPHFDWLKHGRDIGNIHATVLSGAVVRDILLGKLTNCEYIVKQYIKSLHVKNINWKTYISYLNHLYYPALTLKWLDYATTDPNAAMEYLSKSDNSRKRLFRDMINQALALGKKINPKWSEKRMDEEHTKMTREIMQAEIKEKKQIPVHKDCPMFKYPCKILNTERDVFDEGLEMHHCIYTNYWNRIRDKRYLGIAFTQPERFTLGLRASENGYEFDQAYLKYDKMISEESQLMIDTFLNDSDVMSQLNNLEHNCEKKINRQLDNENVNIEAEDEEWVNSIIN